MSSFVVENETINKVATFIYHLDRQNHWVKRQLTEQGIDTPEQLGEAMYQLNLGAVDARYGDGEAAQMCDLNYKFDYTLSQTIPTIKALQCWRYQCSEGTCDETLLFKILSEYLSTLALRVVADLKEYELAAWG